MSDTSTPTDLFADAGKRATATIVDIMVFSIPIVLAAYATSSGRGPNQAPSFNWLGSVLIFGPYLVYATLMTHFGGQTLGNRAAGTSVIDSRTGDPVSIGQAFSRTVVHLVSVMLLVPWLVSLVLIFTDRAHQTLHDKVAHTVTIKE